MGIESAADGTPWAAALESGKFNTGHLGNFRINCLVASLLGSLGSSTTSERSSAGEGSVALEWWLTSQRSFTWDRSFIAEISGARARGGSTFVGFAGTLLSTFARGESGLRSSNSYVCATSSTMLTDTDGGLLDETTSSDCSKRMLTTRGIPRK